MDGGRSGAVETYHLTKSQSEMKKLIARTRFMKAINCVVFVSMTLRPYLARMRFLSEGISASARRRLRMDLPIVLLWISFEKMRIIPND